MGRIMQKRVVRKLDLEKILTRVKSHPKPNPHLEQYTIPTNIAATMLHIAAYSYNDVIGKSIVDLGCGTGRLALGAAILGARDVVGIDIDGSSVKIAHERAEEFGLADRTQWVIGDIEAIEGPVDTVLENPPFGVQQPKADRRFLRKALEIGEVVYSLHKGRSGDKRLVAPLRANSSRLVAVRPSPFLERFINDHSGRIRAVYAMLMMIPHMFDFHTRKTHDVIVDLYVIESESYVSKHAFHHR
jgi:putative methylase